MSRTFLLSLLVLATGVFWGLYWIPLRRLDALGLPGAWGTLAICCAALVVLLPFAIPRLGALRATGLASVGSILLGGFAFALFSISLNYGEVAIVLVLFYLTPVWSTLIGRALFGWPITGARQLALLLGLGGLVLLMSSDGQWPVPRGLGEWLGLLSGFLWSVSSTGIRTQASAGPVETCFAFVLGACLCGVLLSPILAPGPGQAMLVAPWELAFVVLIVGALWWAVVMALFLWCTKQLEPARVGILLMTEVLVGAVTAAIWASEVLSPLEWLGAVLVLSAGIAELWRAAPAKGQAAQ